MNKRVRGFSLVELVVVMAVISVLATIAVPQIQSIRAKYKLDASGRATAGLLQQARLLAVRNNQPAYVQFSTASSPNLVFLNTDKTAYASGEPVVTVGGGVTMRTAPPANYVDQLNAYLGQPLGVTVEPATKPIGFNARGLPCVSGLNPAVCLTQDAGQPAAFLWLMATDGGTWQAVTVTTAGRIKVWRVTNSVTNCGYTVCWQ